MLASKNISRYRFAYRARIETLYKFKSFSGEQIKHVLDMVLHHRIFLSSPSQLNDPFDLSPAVQLAFKVGTKAGRARYISGIKRMLDRQRPRLSPEVVANQLEQLHRASSEEMSEHANTGASMLLAQMEDRFPIFSLSAEYLNPLLWAHYSTHRGVCVHFDARKGRSPFAYARRVLYSETRPFLTMPGPAPNLYKIADMLALTKSKDWAYEKEYRLLSNPDDRLGFERCEGRYAYFDSSAIQGVTLGFAMPKSDQDLILAIAHRQRPSVPVWRTVPDKNDYKLSVEKLEW
jgi:hypothetical protein